LTQKLEENAPSGLILSVTIKIQIQT